MSPRQTKARERPDAVAKRRTGRRRRRGLAAGGIHLLTDAQTVGAQSEPQSIQARIDQAAPGDTIRIDGASVEQAMFTPSAVRARSRAGPVTRLKQIGYS